MIPQWLLVRSTPWSRRLKAAGLVDTLKGEGPFTVFAPTDEAFAKLPEGTLEGLLADKAKLGKVLTYHVVPGKVMSSDLAGVASLKTVEGSDLMVADIQVSGADIATSNGVIHVVNEVLIPQALLVQIDRCSGVCWNNGQLCNRATLPNQFSIAVPGSVSENRKDDGQTDERRCYADSCQKNDGPSPDEHGSRICRYSLVAGTHRTDKIDIFIEDIRYGHCTKNKHDSYQQ